MAEDLLHGISQRLHVAGSGNEQIIRELRSHLQASQYELELSGSTPSKAVEESIRRFGDPDDLAEMLTEVHRRRVPRLGSVAALTLALVGLSAWVGTSGTFAALNRPGNHVQATRSRYVVSPRISHISSHVATLSGRSLGEAAREVARRG